MTKKTVLTMALAGASLFVANEACATKIKCYGVAKAGKNDCGDYRGKHGCAGKAKTNGDPNDWNYLEPAECAKLGGGMGRPKG